MKEIRNKNGLTEEEFLANYKPGDYERPSNTVDMLLFTIGDAIVTNKRKDSDKELKVLLIKRKDHPDIGKWALPGGFVNIDEDVDCAAYRELLEETSVDNVYMEQLYTFGKVNRDKRMRVISISHMALVPQDNVKPIAGDDAEEVAWFSVSKTSLYVTDDNKEVFSLTLWNEELDLMFVYTVEVKYEKNGVVSVPKATFKSQNGSEGIAFDHIEMINMGIDRLRNKVEYVPIAFNLVPEKFTLNEIQKVYETILGRPLVKQNFRKWIDKFVEETDEKQTRVGHRPANLFRYVEKKFYDGKL